MLVRTTLLNSMAESLIVWRCFSSSGLKDFELEHEYIVSKGKPLRAGKGKILAREVFCTYLRQGVGSPFWTLFAWTHGREIVFESA
jgi:hypothetical protein